MVDGIPVAQHLGHGFGTKSIKFAVKRMNGNCRFASTATGLSCAP